jgi:small subunit ribosomal protein S20
VPIKQAARKYLRASKRRADNNLKAKKTFREAVKKLRDLAKAGKFEDARKMMPIVQQALDKAAKIGVLKKNAASRKKSRLSKLIKNLGK